MYGKWFNDKSKIEVQMCFCACVRGSIYEFSWSVIFSITTAQTAAWNVCSRCAFSRFFNVFAHLYIYVCATVCLHMCHCIYWLVCQTILPGWNVQMMGVWLWTCPDSEPPLLCPYDSLTSSFCVVPNTEL